MSKRKEKRRKEIQQEDSFSKNLKDNILSIPVRVRTYYRRIRNDFHNGPTLWRSVLTLVSFAFVIALIWAWLAQTRQEITCNVGPGAASDTPKMWTGYVEINLKRQHPTEPTFHGELFFLYVDEGQKAVSSVTVTSSAVGTYAPTVQRIETVWDDTFFNALRPKGDNVAIAIVAQSGLHQYFPFDSATFDFRLSAIPTFNQRLFRVINRVPGFVLPCDQLKVSQKEDGDLHVSFALRRSPLIQLFVTVLSLAMIVFLVLIVRIRDVGALAPAVASYFFSALSLRTIIAEQIKTFPTFFDCWILTVCMTMVGWLLWTVSSRTNTAERG